MRLVESEQLHPQAQFCIPQLPTFQFAASYRVFIYEGRSWISIEKSTWSAISCTRSVNRETLKLEQVALLGRLVNRSALLPLKQELLYRLVGILNRF